MILDQLRKLLENLPGDLDVVICDEPVSTYPIVQVSEINMHGWCIDNVVQGPDKYVIVLSASKIV